MLDKSSLPDLDNPAAVEAVAEQFGSIGQKTESIISSVSSGWVNVTEAYRAPEEISVSIAFRTPTEIAENLQSETNDLKGHIEDYAAKLTSFEGTKAGLETEIDAVNAELQAAYELDDTKTVPDPANEGETIEVPNEEKQRLVAAAEAHEAAVQAAMTAFEREVDTADSTLAGQLFRATFGMNTIEQIVDGLANLSFVKGAFNGLIDLPKLAFNDASIKIKDIWNHRHQIVDILKHPDKMKDPETWNFVTKYLDLEFVNDTLGFLEDNVDDTFRGLDPSMARHGKAFLITESAKIAHDPAYTLGELAPTVVTGGASVEIKTALGASRMLKKANRAELATFKVKKLKRFGEKGTKDGLKDAGKKFGKDLYKDTKEAAQVDAFNAYVEEREAEDLREYVVRSSPAFGPMGVFVNHPTPKPDYGTACELEPGRIWAGDPLGTGEYHFDRTPVAPQHSLPIPGETPANATPSGPYVFDPTPVRQEDSPSPYYGRPTVSLSGTDETVHNDASCKGEPLPLHSTAPDEGTTPAPTSTPLRPYPDTATEAHPVVAQATPTHSPISVAETQSVIPAPAAAHVPETVASDSAEAIAPDIVAPGTAKAEAPTSMPTIDEALKRNFDGFTYQVFDNLSSASGMDVDSVRDMLTHGSRNLTPEADQLLNRALETNPELSKLLREHGFTGDFDLRNLEEALGSLTK